LSSAARGEAKEEVEDVLESCERFLDKVRDIIKTAGKK